MDCFQNWSTSPQPQRLQRKLLEDYLWHKQTYRELAETYQRSIPWVQQQLDRVGAPKLLFQPQPIVLIMDATFFSRTDGLFVAVDAHVGQRLYYRFITSETVNEYVIALDTLESIGYEIQAVVIDGRKGVRNMCEARGIPVQYCHFHQARTLTTYLTKNPQLEANRQLRTLGLTLSRTTYKQLVIGLELWQEQWGDWLKERYFEERTGRMRYSHTRTRSAYFSLKRNLPYLFTYRQHPALNMPNTTNKLDGWFSELKRRLRSHNGLKKNRRNSMIRVLLRGRTD